jgi:excisionase family DNA binding protein
MPETATAPEWLTLSKASAYVGVSPVTIRRWSDANLIPTFRTAGGHRRFKTSDLDRFLLGHGHTPTPTSSRTGGPAHILVVDDDPDVRQMLSVYLQTEGFSVAAGGSAHSALLSIKEKLPDAILVDVQMPGMDGWELLRRIRDVYSANDLPVIMFSGNPRSELRQSSSRGAQGFFQKPFDPQALVRQLRSVIVAN